MAADLTLTTRSNQRRELQSSPVPIFPFARGCATL